MRRSLTLSVLTLSTALGVSACAGDAGNDLTPTTTVVTVVETTTSENETTHETTSTQPAAQEELPADPPSPVDAEPAATPPAAPEPVGGGGSAHNIVPGKIGGDCGTTAAGDSITARGATSCEFAAAVFDAAVQAQYVESSSDPTVTALPQATVTAHSPVTAQSYTLGCRIGSDGSTLTCESPTDSQVGAAFTSPRGVWHSRVTIAG